jgi:hypothetical protein
MKIKVTFDKDGTAKQLRFYTKRERSEITKRNLKYCALQHNQEFQAIIEYHRNQDAKERRKEYRKEYYQQHKKDRRVIL